MGALLRWSCCAGRRPPLRRCRERRPAQPASRPFSLWTPRQAGMGADRGADHPRGAAEHRHHRRQAPVQRDPQPRELLRGDRGRRQGARSGSRSAPASTSCPRPRGATTPARTRGRSSRGRVGIIAVCAIPVLGIYAFGSHRSAQAVFKQDQLWRRSSLFVLGCAFALLACTYLAIQYMLALKRTWFLLPLALVAIAEPILLLRAPNDADRVRDRRARGPGGRRGRRVRAGAADREDGPGAVAPDGTESPSKRPS